MSHSPGTVPLHRQLHPHVNLLPWRQAAMGRQRRGILLRTAGLLAMATAAVGGTQYFLQSGIAARQASLDELRREVAAIAPQVQTAKKTVTQLQRWQGFRQWQPAAQASQRRVLDLLLDFSAQSSAGISLQTVRIQGDLVDVSGEARSKALAVEFVRGIKARGWPAAAPSVSTGSGDVKHFQFLIKPKGKKSK